MCGIAGSINHRLNIQCITKDLYHRGPDEQTTFEEGNVQLHHHRLAILDIQGGRQPMHYGPYTIIFNGEIYNHLEVRQRLDLKGQTHSDTETILMAYEKKGAACLDEFDGMFAFAILDRSKQQLFLARDRAGKKPVYYYSKNDQFIFSSELNALQHEVNDEIDESHLAQFARMGYFYRSSTPYKHTKELPAGSYALIDLQNPIPSVTKWWDILPFYKKQSKDDEGTALLRTDEFLHNAVRRRVESSDLEVGSFLSGGIDSGIVSAIAKQYNPTLKTFTVSFEGEYDEAPLARLVAERYKTAHHEIRISYDHLRDDIVKILTNYGEPFMDSSAIPSYYVSREAKKHLTVILNGDGGDELFGGYRRYVPFAKYDFFNVNFLAKSTASFMHTLMRTPKDKRSKYNYVYRLADLARKNSLATYLSATIDSFEGFENYLVSSPDDLVEVENDFATIRSSGISGLKKIMDLDFDNILAGDLLVKMDIATMAHSLEGRSPLLSKELLEYIPTLKDDLKIRGGKTKYLLRRLAEKYLPYELINQPKRGFEIPLKKWIDDQLKDIIADHILPPNSYCSQFVKPGFIEDCWNRKLRTGDEKRAKMIWTLFSMEVWYKNCYKRNA
jgi:asparagine synthase (glutamine-hydrolysing)